MIEQLQRKHDRTLFDCGTPALNNYLQKRAMQHNKSGRSRTYVLFNKSNKVLAFYSLSMGSINNNLLPERLQKRLPNHSIPIARLGRLAVDKNYQSKGFGKHLLAHALKMCFLLSKQIGMVAVVIDAKDENIRQFYLNYEFEILPDQPLTLWLPVQSLNKLFE